MYHCQLHCYLVGHPCRAFEMIKDMSPMNHFTHEFFASNLPERASAAKADAILVNLQDMDIKEALNTLILGKQEEAELIVLVEKNQMELLTDDLAQIKDIWFLPMSDEEIRFRFLRWQQDYKKSKDFWQTSQYFEATINNVPNLIWYKDKTGIHKKVNDSFCRTVNKTKEQVEGRSHAYIWDVEYDDPACIESELEVMRKKQTCVSEEVIQTGDGMRTLTTYKSPLYDLDGSVMGTVGVAIDVTQERAYEQEIVRKNHTLETIFTTMDSGVICHTVDGKRILSVNRAALKILGYESQDELAEKGFDMVAASVVDEDKEKLKECIEELKKEGDSVNVEYRVQHKDGEILYVMGNVKLLKENGELIYQRFLLDCTAQKLLEKKNERYQMELIQALSVDYTLVCFFDLNTGKGSVLRNAYKNEQVFDSIFNGKISLKESMEQYIQEFVYEEDKDMMLQVSSPEKLKENLSTKNLYSVNYRTVREGKTKYYQMKAVRTGTWDGNYGIVLGFHSVDEEIRNEMEKKSMLEEALLQANKANKAKSVFLSNMSHDIRTPMNAIIGFTSLAINHIDRKEQVEEYLNKIMTSGNHLLSLINDVLDMSRIESGKIQLDENPCSLPDIVHGLYNILQSDINAKQLKLHMEIEDILHEEVYCDKLRLNQVLLNLAGNSVKYTKAGGTVSIRITEKAGAPAGCANYEFHIRDTGIGMSEEFVSHIFEPFEREENSTISRIQGTGLGMAITKNIVDMMNGSIAVQSKQGVGTEFTVSFTFRLQTEAGKLQAVPEWKDARVLFVNCDKNTCDSVTSMLRQLGMKPESALSEKEAVQYAKEAASQGEHYQAYIIDRQLIDRSGLEVIREICKESEEQEPVVILSAYEWADIEEEAKEAGVTAFCNKPMFLSEIRNCLHSVIHTDEASEESSRQEMEAVHKGRILLAEDVEMNQEIAVAILGDAGFSIEVAENGQIALNMLKQSEPGYYQVVLMDVQMPVMNGYEATKAIRKLENKELASIPILAMSANAFEEDRREALKCGMNGHIAKPIDVDILFQTLGKILS